MEMQANQGRQKKIFDRMAAERRDQIMEFRKSRNQEGLNQLQEELIKLSAEEVKNTPSFKITEEQRKAYTTVGGTPFLDNEYTVFGQVIEGLEIIDKIQQVKTASGDRPVEDVKMKMKIVNK
jgi:cyclophilin family peptidyl-prolyl cis-trans isomerase